MAKATTVRFTDEIYQRLDQASARTGLPVNSIVVAACLEWMQRHAPEVIAEVQVGTWPGPGPMPISPPRWSTLNRAVKLAMSRKHRQDMYPFDRFTDHAKSLLTRAQDEAQKAGFSYIGTEHLLIAAFAPDFHSARVLAALNVQEDGVRDAVKNVIGNAKLPAVVGMIPTSRVKRVIEIAFAVCSTMSRPRVETGHILLALAIEGESIAGHVLKDMGAGQAQIEKELDQLTEPEP
jgi:Clp amino terminal domain, pathogenicity island component